MPGIENNNVFKFKVLEIFAVSFFLFFITYNLFFGQKIDVGNGLGFFDGAATGLMFKHFGILLKTHTFDFYQLQHIFPNMGFYITTKIFHIPITDHTLLIGAIITNYVFLLIGLLFFYLCAYKLQQPVRIMIFSGMFLNFAVLKFSGYYTLIPDTAAFSLGVLLLYSYLKENKILFLLTALAGSFTFPTFALLGLLLFCFELNTPMKKVINHNNYNRYIPILIALTVVFSSVAISLHYYQLFGATFSPIPHYLTILFDHTISLLKPIFSPSEFNYLNGILENSITSINYKFYLFSLIVLYFYMYYAQKQLFANISIKDIFSRLKLKKALIYIILIYGVSFLIKYFYCTTGVGYSKKEYFFTISYEAIVNPICFLVMHFVYYGPIILLFLILFKEFIAQIKASSAGLFLLTVFSFIVAIDSESRHLLNVIPILIFFLGVSINQNKGIIEKLTPRFLTFFVGLSLFNSCFWLKIRLPAQLPNSASTQLFQEFPFQSYFMFHGPWTSHDMCYIFLAIFLTFLIGFYTYLKTSFCR